MSNFFSLSCDFMPKTPLSYKHQSAIGAFTTNEMPIQPISQPNLIFVCKQKHNLYIQGGTWWNLLFINFIPYCFRNGSFKETIQ